MNEPGRVLVIIAEQQVRIYHTPGTEVACVVDGEDVQLPDEWREGLTQQVTHSLPISLDVDEMFGDCEPDFDEDRETTEECEHRWEVVDVTASCMDCMAIQPKVEGGVIGPQWTPADSEVGRSCKCCGAAYGEKHSNACADQNLLVDGGDIVGHGM